MKFNLLILFILHCEIASSQLNFNKLIDLEFGQFNYQLDFELKDTFLLISSKHLCATDSFNIDFVTCTGLSKFGQRGNLVQKILLDSFYPEGLNRMLVIDSSILLTGHNHETFEGRPTVLKYFNFDLMQDSSNLIGSSFNSIVNNEGIIEYNNSFYLYGTKLLIEQSKEYSNIIKIDSKGEEVWNKIYSRVLIKTKYMIYRILLMVI